MSEKILKALLQLFAIIARGDGLAAGARPENATILERFLRRQFSPEVAAAHMACYEAHVRAFHEQGGGRKRMSLNSVKVLRICTQINEELNLRQKFVVLVHLLEFIHAQGEPSAQEMEFVATVAETFNIGQEDFGRCLRFTASRETERTDAEHLLVVDRAEAAGNSGMRHLHAHDLEGELRILNVPAVGLHLARYSGAGDVLLNGQRMAPVALHVLDHGCSIRPPGGQPIYYSDILGAFMRRDERPGLVIRAEHLEYTFPNGRKGLHELHLAETSGKLIGIMGGSGSGKSTLLNVLNGSLKPSQGRVTINGIDVHRERGRIRGVIGHVSQDDLLIEELTVFQNLYYNAKLCFGHLDEQGITERVLHVLRTLGLFEIKDLKVGSPLNKTISGGQRKRLNIALELIREPSVLFVDEPTSGLSSRDSENIMDLLKGLALKGRLVFTVIHQPSSEIFKLFDRLLLMDQEGHPVYYGDPVDAVVYFKRVTGQANSEEGQCRACGNVNPEQIFNILEGKLVDEYGNETDQRRVGPEAWNEVFRAQMQVRVAKVPDEHGALTGSFSPPNWWKQARVFFARDLLSKLANRQYVLINLLEAPALAFMMSFFLKYHSAAGAAGYVFRENSNMPQYLFIAVIVALFLGLTVSAEEILRDRRILQREKFLALSWGSYLGSKVGIMFLISALQSFLFVQVANSVLGIQDMALAHWAMFFSVSCFANVLGLNVSAAFNSAKVIYILIPVLIIPQLLFSGIIVRFDKLHPWFASQRSVPWIGNIMASRWAYEGLAVKQFMDNPYERRFYAFDQRMKSANWKKDLWVRELQNSAGEVRRAVRLGEGLDAVSEGITLLRNELARESERLQGFSFPLLDQLVPGRVDEEVLDAVDEALGRLVTHYRGVYRAAEREKEDLITKLTATEEKRADYFRLYDAYRNESLAEVVTNRNEVHVLVNDRGALVQKSDPIYLEPQRPGIFAAHFYAPAKRVLGARLHTYAANTLVLWCMSLLFLLTLYTEVFPKMSRRLASIGVRRG